MYTGEETYWDSVFRAWGSCWGLVGKEVFLRLDDRHPHTQHTHTHINMVRRFPLPWGWYNVHQVCVCSCRGRSQTIRRVCSVSLRVFDIQITMNNLIRRSVHTLHTLRLRRYTPPKHSNNIILVLSFVYRLRQKPHVRSFLAPSTTHIHNL